jgi:hypothetical protein
MGTRKRIEKAAYRFRWVQEQMLRGMKLGYIRLKDMHVSLVRSLNRREWRRVVIIRMRGRHVNRHADWTLARQVLRRVTHGREEWNVP